MSDTVIRPATAADLEAIRQLVNTSWRATYSSVIPDNKMEIILARRHGSELLRQQFGVEGDVFLIAERNGVIVGHAYAAHRPDTLYLDRLHVAPGLKGQGIGTDLMVAVFDNAHDGEPVTLEVVDNNQTALGFYKSLGFCVTEHTASCNGEIGVTALVMERPAR